MAVCRRGGRWLIVSPWPLLVAALLLMAGYFWTYGSPTVAMVGLAYYFDFCLGSFLFLVLAAGHCMQVSMRKVYESRSGIVCRPRFDWLFWPGLLTVAIGTYFMVSEQIPMRVGFWLSQSAFDRLADKALADPANAPRLAGRLAGVYSISGVEVIGKTVVLYLGKDKGSYGFARVPGATGGHWDFPSQDGPNDREGKRIAGDWFVMYSGYGLVKVGWSCLPSGRPHDLCFLQFHGPAIGITYHRPQPPGRRLWLAHDNRCFTKGCKDPR
jgi:hypothetical protein